MRTPSSDSDSAAQDGDAAAGSIEGRVKPSDCHSLLRERKVESGPSENSGLNGSAEPRWRKLESAALKAAS